MSIVKVVSPVIILVLVLIRRYHKILHDENQAGLDTVVKSNAEVIRLSDNALARRQRIRQPVYDRWVKEFDVMGKETRAILRDAYTSRDALADKTTKKQHEKISGLALFQPTFNLERRHE